MMLILLAIAAYVQQTSPPEPPPAATAAAQESVGTASRRADGTIVLQLRSVMDDGTIAEGQLEYAPSHPDYGIIARHVGPIPAGGHVTVTPFPDERPEPTLKPSTRK